MPRPAPIDARWPPQPGGAAASRPQPVTEPAAPSAHPSIITRIVLGLVLGMIRGYQWLLSPLITALLGARCRFYPSCSEYGAIAIRRYGLARGGRMTVRRLCRCHPFHPGGFDPPEATPPDPVSQEPRARRARSQANESRQVRQGK